MSNFLYRLLPNSDWVLCAVQGDKKSFQTFTPNQRQRALEWIDCFPGAEIKVLAGNPNRICLSNPTIDHVRDVLAIGIRAPLSKAKAILSLRDAPAIAFTYAEKFIAVWRFRKPVPPRDADRAEQDLVERLGGERLRFFVPLPRRDLADVERFTDATIDLKDIAALSVADDEEDDFMDATAVKVEPTRWLKKGFIPNSAIFYGEAKTAKSTGAADFAAHVSAGGKWFDGEPVAGESRGQVLFWETEDNHSQVVVPRLLAAGASLGNIKLGRKKLDFANPVELGKIKAVAAGMQNCRLIVLSPLLSFFTSSDNNKSVMRDKIEPFLKWADTNGIAVIGIMHLDKQGKTIGGSSVFLETFRSAIHFSKETDPRQMIVTHSNVGRTGASIPYDTKTEFISVSGVKIETSRMVWLDPDDAQTTSQDTSQQVEKTTNERAQEWLIQQLQNAPDNRIDAAALKRRSPFSKGTLDRAAERIGIVREDMRQRMTDSLVWRLP